MDKTLPPKKIFIFAKEVENSQSRQNFASQFFQYSGFNCILYLELSMLNCKGGFIATYIYLAHMLSFSQ